MALVALEQFRATGPLPSGNLKAAVTLTEDHMAAQTEGVESHSQPLSKLQPVNCS